MVPYCSIMEGDDMHGHLSFSFMSGGCFQLNLWWQMEYEGLYFRITIVRAFILYKKSLRFFQDIWDLVGMTF